MSSWKVSPQIDRSLKACIKEGMFSQVMTGIFDYYLNPFAIFLKATTLEIGLLASIPGALSSFFQFFAVAGVRWLGNRKALLTKGSFLQALLLLPIPFLLFLHHRSYRVEYLIILVTIFRVLGAVMGPAWGSLVSEYLPSNLRGAFFGKRTQLISMAGLVGMAFWGIFLSSMHGREIVGFFIIFAGAAVCRFISTRYMGMLVELHQAAAVETRPMAGIHNKNFGFFVFYVAAVTFATQMSSPYTSVYMLSDLKFSYWSYMCVNLASMFTGLISFPVWGRHADMIGNHKVLRLTGWLIPLTPLLYMFARTPMELFAVETFNGFIWGGFNLCATNFIYDSAPAAKRVQYLCYSNVLNGMALFIGASLGGMLASWLPAVHGSRLFFLFLISALCRLAAHVAIFPHIKEVRISYRKVRSVKLFFSVLGIRPVLGHDVEPEVLFHDSFISPSFLK